MEEKKAQAIKMEKRLNLEPKHEESRAINSNLKFPGRVLCIPKQKGIDQNLLIISDTGNNRLVIVNEETLDCMGTIGNGKVGLVDGGFDEASFHHP